MSEKDELSFIKGSVATRPIIGLSDKIYLAHVLDAIGTGAL